MYGAHWIIVLAQSWKRLVVQWISSPKKTISKTFHWILKEFSPELRFKTDEMLCLESRNIIFEFEKIVLTSATRPDWKLSIENCNALKLVL